MTAVTLQRSSEQPVADLNPADEPPVLEISDVLSVNGDEHSSKRKHKRRNKEERRKRSRSCSSDSCCSSSSKRKKKKKKHQKRRSLDEPPSPKVNPIFLWVKEDNAKIVEVRCEDYDRRNRIKLTKTAGGWRATPHVEIKEWQPADAESPRDDSENEGSTAPTLEPEAPLAPPNLTADLDSADRDDLKSDTPPPLLESYQDEPLHYRSTEPEEPPTSAPQRLEDPPPPPPPPQTNSLIPDPDEPKPSSQVQDVVDLDSPEASPQPLKVEIIEISEDESEEDKRECAIKCCEEPPSSIVDENHNNEFESDSRSSCMLEQSNFCEDVLEMLGAMDDNSVAKEGQPDQEEPPQSGADCSKPEEYDHSALMSELEEIMNERLKQDHPAPNHTPNLKPPILEEIYNFVPSPTTQSQEKAKPKEQRPTSKIERVIEAVKAKSAKANAVIEAQKSKDPPTLLKSCELENLDLLWRLPEGTTIHHSKPLLVKDVELGVAPAKSDAAPATISLVKPPTPTIATPPVEPGPVQEEPLNLGKPRRQSPAIVPPAVPVVAPPVPQPFKKETPPSCKLETKPLIPLPHPLEFDAGVTKPVKTGERFTPDASKSTEPLAQLKEIMSDPDVTVPDPLLVPKERLSALIANPKREIPRLMALTNEVKYPKVDTNVLEVSLAHLQLLLQSSKKEDELKLFQKHADILQSHLKNDSKSLDPATMSALNQMLWFPYLSHLDVGRNASRQDLVGMMNMMYPYNAWGQQTYDYPHQSHLMNFWQDVAHKPHLSGAAHPPKGYTDLYKAIPPVMPPSLYTSAPSVDPSPRVHPSPPFPQRTTKHHSSRRHRPASSVPNVPPGTTPNFFKSPHFDLSPWSLPQTSESPRVAIPPPTLKMPVRADSTPFSPPPSSTSTTTTTTLAPPTSASFHPPVSSSSEQPPKLKVRKFDVDPNAVPKLINKNLTSPALSPLAAMTRQVPSQYYDANHLWNPLYAPPESREGDYTTGHWNWTTPVTVSGK